MIYHLPNIAFATFCKWKSIWLWFQICADGLLKIYNHHQIPLKRYIWLHYQPKKVAVFCKSPFHGRTSVYEECIECDLVLAIWALDCQKTSSGKWKIWHATIVAIKILRPNLNDEHFEKINIKTAITYNKIFLCQITVYGEFQIVEPSLPKRENDKNFKKLTLLIQYSCVP